MANLANLCIGNANIRVNRGGTTEGTLGFGYYALRSTNGANARNTAFGRALIDTGLSHCYNTAVGHLAGCANTSGQQNTSVGHYAGRAITTPYQNNAFGFRALCSQTTGCRQIAIGACAMYSCNGNASIGIGFRARTNTANCSVAIGAYATALGNRSVAIGYKANTDWSNNVIIGACSYSGGNNNTVIGFEAKTTAVYCNITIGYCAKTSYDNQILIGSMFTNTCPAGAIVMGSGINSYSCIYVDWSYCSDRNEKTNIQPLPYNFGLPFIKKLRPVKFNWDIRERYVKKCGFEWGQKDGSLVEDKENYGLIAQELEQVLQELNLRFDGLTKNDKKYHLASTNLLAPLVKSIQQLSAKLDTIKERLTTLENN
jgi:hypothetical protein